METSHQSLREKWSGKPNPGLFFLDSGAHSLFNEHSFQVHHNKRYAFFDTQEFWDYVDSYARFVLAHKDSIDYYVNVDVIHNPEKSWEVLKYLEGEYGLSPVPVIHAGTSMRWVERHIRAGYDYIGIGGVARESDRGTYVQWANQVFSFLCPSPQRLPIVRTHGFAMTSFREIVRYPFWSVDSASWAKSAAFGSVYIPHKRKGVYTFGEEPYVVCFSWRAPSAKVRGRHFNTYSEVERRIIVGWLEEIDIPLGKVDKEGQTLEEGVINHYGSRGVANMRFFERLCAWLPKWPWPFAVKSMAVKGFL